MLSLIIEYFTGISVASQSILLVLIGGGLIGLFGVGYAIWSKTDRAR